MSLLVTQRAEFDLANLLLPEAKAYLRIKHADEDAVLTFLIGAAIGQFERLSEQTIFPTVYEWTFGDSDLFIGGQIEITPSRRITPINVWTAAADGDDVISAYSLAETGREGGVNFYALVGGALPGLVVTIESGFPSPDVMPFSMKEIIFRMTSTSYEYREKFTPGNIERHPDWDNHDLAGFWVPHA
jgi:uncharacterized phiE125 gp8 family phage protein